MKIRLLVPSLWLAMILPALAVEPILIGACVPLTGDLAASGRSIRDGITAAHAMFPDVLGRRIELRITDTRSNKAEAANAIFRLIEKDRVAAIICDTVSADTIAGLIHANTRTVPIVTHTASTRLTTQNEPRVFRISSVPAEQASLAARLAVNRMAAATATVIRDISEESSVEMASAFKHEFIRTGGKIVCEMKCRRGDRDFTAQIGWMEEAKPAVIYAPIRYVECALIARQLREAGLDTPIIASDLVHVPELIEFGGKSVENLIFTTHFHDEVIRTVIGEKLRSLCMNVTGTPLHASQVVGADAYLLVLGAIEGAGSSVPSKVRLAMRSTGCFKGITGTISIDRDGSVRRPLFINVVKDGQFVQVPHHAASVR